MNRPTRQTSFIQRSGLFFAIFSLFAFLLLSLSGSHVGAGQKVKDKDSVAGEVIVKLKSGASEIDVKQLEQDTDSDVNAELSRTGNGVIRRIHSRSKTTDELITKLKANSKVEYAEPNYILQVDTVPNDPSFGQLYGLRNT